MTFDPVIRLDVAGLVLALVALLIRTEVRLSGLEGRVSILWAKVLGRPWKEKA